MAGEQPDQGAGDPPSHPLLSAISPLVDRIGATLIDPDDLADDDVPLAWNGAVIVGIRLSGTAPTSGGRSGAESAGGPGGPPTGAPDNDTATGLDGMLADLALQLGAPLAGLSRPRKQEAVRMLEESGAFSYRKSVETIAAALGISRFTVYNYLNRDRG